jgi:hypothetical protein
MHVLGAILDHETGSSSISSSIGSSINRSSSSTSGGGKDERQRDPSTSQAKDITASAPMTERDPPAHNGTLRPEEEMEALAVAEAAAEADASYVPTPSLLNNPDPAALLVQVDGPSIANYSTKESTYIAKRVPVPLRGRLDVPIHISAGGSVVSYEMSTENYDISFGVCAEREEGVTVVAETARVDSHKEAVTGKFLVGSVPCAIVFTFDNEYSWFREKFVTYTITVQPPSTENIVTGRRSRTKAALRAVKDDLASAEKRLEKAIDQRTTLAAEISRMEKELTEKKKSLDVAVKEEGWLKDRTMLRKQQTDLLNKRMTDGWADEKTEKETE